MQFSHIFEVKWKLLYEVYLKLFVYGSEINSFYPVIANFWCHYT